MNVAEALPNTRADNHIAGQLIRSGSSPAPNYGEAQSAESRKDFIHKTKVALKELRETPLWLEIVRHKPLIQPESKLIPLADERNELISIFVTSINTAQANLAKE
jgi:four helix bundle protein